MSESPSAGNCQGGGRVAGVILAGGRARRMGGVVKSLLPLAGKPMLGHVIDRVRPQVAGLALSVEHAAESFEAFGLQQLADSNPDGGPLGGLLAAMQWMESTCDWLLLVPCDAPFVPLDLAACLLESATGSGKAGALVCYAGEIQPTFSLWHRRVLPALVRAVTVEGMAGFKQFLQQVELAERAWPQSTPSPFFNINDRDALKKADSLMNTLKEDSACSV
jgi:molybdopterin-guanine dinucleotide biosynthesis protein A